MRFDMELTRKQAEKIIYNMATNGFHIHGLGHFDLSWEERVKLIQLAFGRKGDDKCSEYFKQLQSKYMG